MVQLVVLSLLAVLTLAGCSTVPQGPEQMQAQADDLPQWQDGMMTSFTDGSNHPAVAALFAKAESARQEQQWRRAMTYLDQARQIQPRNPAVFYRAAWVAMQTGDARQAEQLLQRGLVFAQGDHELTRRLQLLLAEALDAQGRVIEADSLRRQAARG
ncbi:tetratricopeptide repeat protein [Thalassolituus sp. LLYu03]|uniref:tetratricopeptide repeat protein n=1 Tax=Thalassolituus sp. LLYu03 TaxID=3421656 RepID=UPI003D2BACDC